MKGHRAFTSFLVLATLGASTGCEYGAKELPVKETTQTTESTETKSESIDSSATYRDLETKIKGLQDQMVGQNDAQAQALRQEIDRLRNELAAAKENTPPPPEEPSSPPAVTTKAPRPSDKTPIDDTKSPGLGKVPGAVVATVTTTPAQTRDSTTAPAAPKKVEGITVYLQTCSGSHVQDGSTDTDGKIMFDLCPTSNFNDRGCFRARFNDQNPQHISLDAGEYATLNFVQDPQLIDSTRKKMKDLKYPDDFKYFRFASDPDNKVHDGWCLQGVELKVKLEDEDYKPIYRNPCLMRWIEADPEEGQNLYSPHSIENDDAFCLYVENGSGDNAGTDDSVFARVPMNQDSGNYRSFDDTTITWLNAYKVGLGESPEIVYNRAGSSHFEVKLHYNDWDDFGDDDDDQRCASYTWTVYDGGHRMAETLMKLRSSGSDAMKIRRVRAYSFRPGDPSFLSNNECRYAERVNADFWLGGDSDDDGELWPLGDWLRLEEKNCPQLSDIRLNGQWAFDKFGENCRTN